MSAAAASDERQAEHDHPGGDLARRPVAAAAAEQDGGIDQDDRRDEGQQADQDAQPQHEPLPEEPAVPAEVQDEDEKDRDGDAGQGADLAPAAAAWRARPRREAAEGRAARRDGAPRDPPDAVAPPARRRRVADEVLRSVAISSLFDRRGPNPRPALTASSPFRPGDPARALVQTSTTIGMISGSRLVRR